MEATEFSAVLQQHQGAFHPIVPFDPGNDKLYPLDFTDANTLLDAGQIADTERFAAYINAQLLQHNGKYGIGGYGEHRTLYARSAHFDIPAKALSGPGGEGGPREEAGPGPRKETGPLDKGGAAAGSATHSEEPRRLHLGIDVWGPAGTRVMSPLDGIIHSFAFNNNDSDYGATLILTHQLAGIGFHTLYGHLSLNSLKNLYEGKNISKGEVIGEFGMRFENGNWPPHLHFQLIRDMQGWRGDYPGVCRFSERATWMANCPDPDLILQLNRFLKKTNGVR